MKLKNLLYAGFIAFIGINVLLQIIQREHAKDWPQTEGVIQLAHIDHSTRTEWREIGDSRRRYDYTEYELRVSYAYEVDSIPYEGRRIRILQQKTRSLNSAEALFDRFAPGTTVAVFYDPKAPSESVLIR